MLISNMKTGIGIKHIDKGKDVVRFEIFTPSKS